jgi:AbrB family looped-hinge helix DNA binding protein
MTLRIDKAGRVVLPKPLRDRLGLHSGASLELLETPDGLVLKPADRRPSVIRRGRFLVHTGELPDGYDIAGSIAADRDARALRVLGLNTGSDL